MELEWVYGIKTNEIRKGLQYVTGKDRNTQQFTTKIDTDSSIKREDLIFVSGCVIVVFSPKVN